MIDSQPYIISPSRVARYFFHQCERHLRFFSTPKSRRIVDGVPEPPYDASPVTRAILEGGYVWETEVVERRARQRVRVNRSQPAKRLRERVFEADETIEQLQGMSDGEYLYQATLVAPPSLYQEYRLDPQLVRLASCRPDLLQCIVGPDGQRRMRVHDVKASTGVKLSHRIQVGLYTMILDHVVRGLAADVTADLEEGGVWLHGQDSPETFRLQLVLPYLKALLEDDLPRVLGAPPDHAEWHLNYRCEWCEYFDYCFEEALKTKSVSLLPYLSTPARRHLRANGVDALDDLATLLEQPGVESILAASASLAGRRARLQLEVASLQNTSAMAYGSTAIAMPVHEDIVLLLTLQREPVSGLIYAAAFLRRGGAGVFGDNQDEAQFVAERPDRSEETCRRFIQALHKLLLAVHEYNASREWREQLGLQAYVFDSYERDLLINVLQQGLKDPQISEESLELMFHFHSEALAAADEHPADHTEFPLVSLSGVIRTMYALPLPVAYHLADVSRVLQNPKRKAFVYERTDFFDFLLSNALKSDAIHGVWHGQHADWADRIARRLRIRLYATGSVIDGIRANAVMPSGRQLLFAWPAKFSLPSRQPIRNPVLSRLAFITRYESLLGCLQTKDGRGKPREEREVAGITFNLTALGETRFVAEPAELAAEAEASPFSSWLLTEDNDDGEQAQLSFPDYSYRKSFWAPGNRPIDLAALTDVSIQGAKVIFTLNLTEGKASPPIQVGGRYQLNPRFTDWTADQVIDRLAAIDRLDTDPEVQLLTDPLGYDHNRPRNDDLRRAGQRLAETSGFTPSQEKAYRHVLEHALTVVWGPPGTGKTHFLAQTIINLLRAAQNAGRPMRILVTAFTHTAIENCLAKVDELARLQSLTFPVAKLDRIDSPRGQGLACLKREQCSYHLAHNLLCVVGGTPYSMTKAFPAHLATLRPFDAIAVDEGSQLKVAESLLPTSRLAETGGRLVVAGDDLQLPPIIKGAYPDQQTGTPPLHRSLFEVLRYPDLGRDEITVQLLENFRMNDCLCAFPAAALYGSGYDSVNDVVRRRRLRLSRDGLVNVSDRSNGWLQFLLDPEYPWALGILEDVQAGAENLIEAQLVAQAAWAIRERIALDSPGGPLVGSRIAEDRFWRDGLFIVSPHHVQIRAIRRGLRELGFRRSFVDTVDKMQGQECEAVIVSYGLSDSEQAAKEGEFIYHLNRLNVAITRAKSKCIVFLPRPLLRPTLGVLEVDDAVRGLSYMLQLEQHVQKGERSDYPLPQGQLVAWRFG